MVEILTNIAFGVGFGIFGLVIGIIVASNYIGKVLDGYRLKYGFNTELEKINFTKSELKNSENILKRREKRFNDRVQKDRERAGYT